MNNTSDVWLNIEEVCSLTNSKKETIRRKCKSGEYKCRFELAGRNKNYQILLSSMPLKYIEKYKSYLTPTSQNEVEQSLEAYSNAQLFSRVGMYAKLEVLNDDDKQAIISSLLPNYKHIYPILSAFCAGNTRVLTKLLVRAIRIAELNEVEVDEEVIKASVKQILV